MNRWHLFTCVTAFCAMMLAQIGAAQDRAANSGSQPYQPAVPAATTVNAYGGYGGNGGGASTAAGSAMNGMANAISAKGNYNLSTSAAAINMTQARKNSIQNQQLYEDTYFQMREANQAYQKAQIGPRPTQEQLARWARDAAPRPVSTSEVNPVSGKVNWPAVLQQDGFAAQRATLEKLSAAMTTQGSLGFSDQMTARKTIESMFVELKAQIKDIPPQAYVDSRNFLRSMIYALARTDLS